MQTYQIGYDEPSYYGIDETLYAWLVHEYSDNGWDGDGRAAALRISDGLIVHGGLGHCSCYGPFDRFDANPACTPEDFLAQTTDNIFDDVPSDPMKAKVRELLGLDREGR